MRSLPFRLLCALLALIGVAAAATGDDEIIKEFRKYFKKYKDTPSRVEAVLSLGDSESAEVVAVLLPVLKDKEPELVDAAVSVLASFASRPPVDELLRQLESEKQELLRVGILRALAEGQYAHSGAEVQACLEDKSWDVRRRAAQALAATGQTEFGASILPLARDREPAVRCAALDGLTLLDDVTVLPPAIELLGDDSWQVRASAIAALGRVRHKSSVAPLIARLEVEEGRLRADLAWSLENLTGRGFGQRTELWERFWEQYGDRFELPTDEALAELREKQRARRAEYKPEGQTTYHGIETPSRSILFVIDVSGSMENEVVEKERFQDGDYPSYSRMDIVKTELARTVEGLESYVKFNILSFATDTKPWKKDLVSANVLNKSSAMDWSLKLEPLGGASKQDLASVGLTGAANLEAGKTNTYGALAWALDMAGRGAQDKHYEVAVDTIFFLSDGRPTHGKYVDIDDILKEVAQANDLRKVVIHTIAIGEFQKTFMKRLAEENGGIFVDLGR
jgi:uncharacterized protein YeaO (DUF488 family)